MFKPISTVLKNMARADIETGDGDYLDEEGLMRCGKCKTRKQRDVEAPREIASTGLWRFSVPCECQLELLAAQAKDRQHSEFQRQMGYLRSEGITDPAYLKHTFAQDDRRDVKISDVCRKYVEQWDVMKADNTGILFYGNVGAGKSFLACCIANALLENLVPACVTNFPRLLNKMQGLGEERQETIDKLQRYALLVIDDLGAERDTSYSVEQIYNIVDTRARSGKPLIVTTNLALSDIENPGTLAYKRIYDRVMEMCPIRLKLTGKSRREEKAAEKRDRARRLLGLTNGS